MAVNNQRKNVAYGLSDALLNVFSPPIVSKRAPTTADSAQIGTLWVNSTTNAAYILTSIVANSATWSNFSGGAGLFTSLTVTPGNIVATLGNISATAGSLSAGTTVTAGTGITATTGNIVATAGQVNAGTTITAGTGLTVTTGGAAITGASTINGGSVGIGTDNAANTISIGLGTVARTIHIGDSGAAHIITIGSTTLAASTLIQGGTVGISLSSAGQVSVATAPASVASPGATVVINKRVGQATYTGFTTAAAGSQVFTVTNSNVTATSSILATVANGGANDAQMTLTRVLPGVGTVDFTTQNFGAQALNGDVIITFWVLT